MSGLLKKMEIGPPFLVAGVSTQFAQPSAITAVTALPLVGCVDCSAIGSALDLNFERCGFDPHCEKSLV